MIRSILIIGAIAFYTAVLAVPGIIGALLAPSGRFFFPVARLWARLILWTAGVKLEVVGRENYARDKSYVIICNHQSLLDIPALLSALPGRNKMVAKKSLFMIPLFGQVLAAAGFISIDRDDREKAFQSYKKAAERLKSGDSIIVFAEGTRTRDGRLGPFKKGGFILALKTDTSILPVSVKGGFDVLSRHSLRFGRGNMRVTVGKPVETANLNWEDRNALLEGVRASILSGLDVQEPATERKVEAADIVAESTAEEN